MASPGPAPSSSKKRKTTERSIVDTVASEFKLAPIGYHKKCAALSYCQVDALLTDPQTADLFIFEVVPRMRCGCETACFRDGGRRCKFGGVYDDEYTVICNSFPTREEIEDLFPSNAATYFMMPNMMKVYVHDVLPWSFNEGV